MKWLDFEDWAINLEHVRRVSFTPRLSYEDGTFRDANLTLIYTDGMHMDVWGEDAEAVWQFIQREGYAL